MNRVSKEHTEAVKNWLGAGSVNIFGRQYAGKDTQCSLLADRLGGVTFGGGDILRNSGEAPQHVLDVINAGGLSPTNEYRAIVIPYFSRQEFDGQPLFLSSVGRMKGEEDVIIDAAERSGHKIMAVVALEIDPNTIWQRFHERQAAGRELRVDDDEAGLEKRLNLYNEFTVPVIEHYRSMGLVIDVDGTKDAELVYTTIINGLLNKAT